jgi:hypothetical protein
MGARLGIVPLDGSAYLADAPGIRAIEAVQAPRAALIADDLARPLVSTPGVEWVAPEKIAERMNAADPEHMPRAMLPGEGASVAADPSGVTAVRRPRPDRIEADLQLAAPNFAVVSEQLVPGWSASLDGARVEIVPADLAMGAVAVPAGRHTLTLQYTPLGWPWAWAGYALAWAAALAALIVGRGAATPDP